MRRPTHDPASPGLDAARDMLRPVATLVARALPHAHVLALVALALYALSGLTIVRQDEVALVLRLGKLAGGETAQAVHQPGLLFAWPRPFDEIVRVPTRRVFELSIDALAPPPGAVLVVAPQEGAAGFESPLPLETAVETLSPERDGYALTGDSNVLQARIIARYQISDPIAFALGHAVPERLIESGVLAAFAETMGGMSVDVVLSDGRRQLVADTLRRAQEKLDGARGGIALVSIELETLTPPAQVLPEFRAVQSAAIEAQTEIKRAMEYRETELPAAAAARETALREADSYAAGALARARGDASRFRSLVDEYRKNPRVVRDRLYAEGMERSLARSPDRIFVPPPAGARYNDMRITVRPKR